MTAYNPDQKYWDSSWQMTLHSVSLKTKTVYSRLPPNPVKVDENLEKKRKTTNKNSIVPSSFLTTSDLFFRIVSFSFRIAKGRRSIALVTIHFL